MPGCTVPNCTNSSQKGFKLYHFPSDRERNLMWVQNCGREVGWKPTKHTCVCEVHFEESQFESHRADGLRKLKPNAVPTIFTSDPPLRSYNRKVKKNNECTASIQEGDTQLLAENVIHIPSESKSDDLKKSDTSHSKSTEKGEMLSDMSSTTEEVFINVALQSKTPNITKRRVKGETRGRPSSKLRKKNENSEWTPKNHRNRKRVRPASPSPSSAKKAVTIEENCKNSERILDILEECPTSETDFKDCSNNENKLCFVCGKSVVKGLSLHTLTNTTKVYMYQKLDKVVTGEVDLLIEEEDLLCTRCANLLNYMDCIEVELSILNKTILNCIRKKYGLANNSSKETESFELDKMGKLLNITTDSAVEASNDVSDGNRSCSDYSHADVPLRCRVCKFTTCFKSVMMYHLRRHLKDSYFCDFCDVNLPPNYVKRLKKNEHCFSSNVIPRSENCVEEQNCTDGGNANVTHIDGISSDIIPDPHKITVALVPVLKEECELESRSEGFSECFTGNTEQVGVLNEIDNKIETQEVRVEDSVCIASSSTPSEHSIFSQLSFEPPIELPALNIQEKTSIPSNDTMENKQYEMLNEIGMIVLRVNIPPGMSTYSNSDSL